METKMNTMNIKYHDFINLQYLAKACEKVGSPRPSLENVFYDSEKKWFIATDGHILRVEHIDLSYEIDFDFVIHQSEFKKHSKKDIDKLSEINVKYTKDSEAEHKYPDYKRALSSINNTKNKNSDFVLIVSTIQKLLKTFPPKRHSGLKFVFTGSNLQGINIYNGRKNNAYFLGVIMPGKWY